LTGLKTAAIAAGIAGFLPISRFDASVAEAGGDEGGIAAADGGRFAANRARYRRLAVTAISPLAKPTEAMVDAVEHNEGELRNSSPALIAYYCCSSLVSSLN
jgi:hypothetical protein